MFRRIFFLSLSLVVVEASTRTSNYSILQQSVADSSNYCCFFQFTPIAHAVLRKWVLLTDPDDKMAGVKVTNTCCITRAM